MHRDTPTRLDGDDHGLVAEPARLATARALHSYVLSHHVRPIPGQDRPGGRARPPQWTDWTDGAKVIEKMNVPVQLPRIEPQSHVYHTTLAAVTVESRVRVDTYDTAL